MELAQMILNAFPDAISEYGLIGCGLFSALCVLLPIDAIIGVYWGMRWYRAGGKPQ